MRDSSFHPSILNRPDIPVYASPNDADSSFLCSPTALHSVGQTTPCFFCPLSFCTGHILPHTAQISDRKSSGHKLQTLLFICYNSLNESCCQSPAWPYKKTVPSTHLLKLRSRQHSHRTDQTETLLSNSPAFHQIAVCIP